VHPGLLSPFRSRTPRRGAALLLTVLVVLTAATITAVLVQVVVTAAGGQQRRLAYDLAFEAAESIERRVANTLAQEPLSVFTTVLDDEVPRRCDADLSNHPDPIGPGAQWPASCGSVWSYAGTGGRASGARLFPPSPSDSAFRVEVFASSGKQRVGFARTFLLGGRARPLLYSGGALDADALLGPGGSLVLEGSAYAIGELAMGGSVVGGSAFVSSETGFVGSVPAGRSALPGGSPDLRRRHGSPLPVASLRSALVDLNRLGCPGEQAEPRQPVNVDGVAAALCLRAGESLLSAAGEPVVFPPRGSYTATLVLPLADGSVQVFTRTSAPAVWPGPLAEWSLLGEFLLPASGVVVTDAPTVLGHCDEVQGVCRDWDDDGRPGATVNASFTLVAGSLDEPRDLHVGGPVRAGSGRPGVFVSGNLYVPLAASPTGEGLELDIWAAVIGRPGAPVLASTGTGTRPTLSWNGALLLGSAEADLSGFLASVWTVPASVVDAPPFFPAPGLRFEQDASVPLVASYLDELFGTGLETATGAAGGLQDGQLTLLGGHFPEVTALTILTASTGGVVPRVPRTFAAASGTVSRGA